MPIRSHLNGQRFDAETIRVMGLAYELTLISLRLFDRGDIANDVVAHKIIELAKAGERDPERLCEAAAMGSSGRAIAHVAPPICVGFCDAASSAVADMPDRQVRANRTQAPQQPTSPTDHLVGASERVGRISRPSRPAAVRLIMRSNLVGCSTGMSAGFAPRRIGGRATNCQIAIGYLCG